MSAKSLDFYYGDFKALTDIQLKFGQNEVTALIGPSGCGKSTLLRCLNRMNDLIPYSRVDGEILLDNQNIYAPSVDVVTLRRRVGMVFQKPNPFPKSIFDNVAYGLRVNGIKNQAEIQNQVEKTLRGAALWDEVKDRLDDSALGLSGGQQQRLCIARAMAVEPEVLLMDEPCSALDAAGTEAVEELLLSLRGHYTIVIVTHNMAQARRISDECIYMLNGELIEHGETAGLFLNPEDKRTEEYIEGRYG